MKKWITMCSVFMIVLMCCPIVAWTDSDDCSNEDDDCTDPCGCEEGGSNPFSVYSGNATREIKDIEINIKFGLNTKQMQFVRCFESRPEWNAETRNDYYFGKGGNWRHNFQWTMMDDGIKNGEQSIQVIQPTGESWFYYKRSTNDLFMTAESHVHSRILPDGTNYYLYLLDGTRYHITQKTVESNKSFRMEGFQDPYSNQYVFSYSSNDILEKVTAPNTNHYF